MNVDADKNELAEGNVWKTTNLNVLSNFKIVKTLQDMNFSRPFYVLWNGRDGQFWLCRIIMESLFEKDHHDICVLDGDGHLTGYFLA